MKELKITVDQLKNYLGTGLHLDLNGDKWGLHWDSGLYHKKCMSMSSFFFSNGVLKPICYRLSDLDKEIEHNGERFVPELQMMEIWSRYHKDSIKSMYQLQVHETELYRVYHDLKKLFEWHFWPFGDEYFEHGLVIDKMKHNV